VKHILKHIVKLVFILFSFDCSGTQAAPKHLQAPVLAAHFGALLTCDQAVARYCDAALPRNAPRRCAAVATDRAVRSFPGFELDS
jgi:hypothetical protein